MAKSRKKEKKEDMSNNYFTLFTENEKIISEELAAFKHKNNTFCVLSSSKIWSFRFDHIFNIGKGEGSVKEEENEGENKEEEEKEKEEEEKKKSDENIKEEDEDMKNKDNKNEIKSEEGK